MRYEPLMRFHFTKLRDIQYTKKISILQKAQAVAPCTSALCLIPCILYLKKFIFNHGMAQQYNSTAEGPACFFV